MDKISVIIPTIGRPSLVSCLDSLEKQTLGPDEIIVIDNSKNKKALSLMAKKARYIHERRPGVAHARNRGILESKNDILCFIDDDCVAEKNWLEKLAIFSEKNKNSIVMGENKNGQKDNIFSCIEYFDEQVFFKKDFYVIDGKIVSFWLDSKNFIIRKNLIKKNRLVFKNFKMGEDLDFSLQARLKNTHVLYCDKATVVHYGRIDLISHLVREIKKGREAKRLQKRWKVGEKRALKEIFFRKELIWKKWIDEKSLKKNLLREIFSKKNFLFKFSFYFQKTLDFVFQRL